jgi:uncharacterized protein YceK
MKKLFLFLVILMILISSCAPLTQVSDPSKASVTIYENVQDVWYHPDYGYVWRGNLKQ